MNTTQPEVPPVSPGALSISLQKDTAGVDGSIPLLDSPVGEAAQISHDALNLVQAVPLSANLYQSTRSRS